MKSIVDFIEQRSMLSHSENITEKQNFLIKGHTKDQNKTQILNCVDLDLPSGLKWATCNIGANKPEDPGLLFQWGRIDGYKYGDKNHKFLSSEDYIRTSGTEYKKGDILKPEDDAAYQATKGRFRMPTKEEMDELLDYTDNEYTELNGIKGMKFISKKDKSKWIFISDAGYFDGMRNAFRGGEDRKSRIWSASASSFDIPFYAYRLYLNSSYSYYDYYLDNTYKSNGFSVRGVLNK